MLIDKLHRSQIIYSKQIFYIYIYNDNNIIINSMVIVTVTTLITIIFCHFYIKLDYDVIFFQIINLCTYPN